MIKPVESKVERHDGFFVFKRERERDLSFKSVMMRVFCDRLWQKWSLRYNRNSQTVVMLLNLLSK